MNQVHKFAKKYFLQLQGPYAQKCLQTLESKGLLALSELKSPNPRGFRTAEEYRHAALASSMFRKTRFNGSGDTRKQAAVDTFYACEHANKLHNIRLDRLRRMVDGSLLIPNSEAIWVEVVVAWRKTMARALGPLPDAVGPVFSNGSTLSDTGKQTTIPDKMSSHPTWYHTSVTHLLHEHLTSGTPISATYELVRANKFFTVPKDSQKDRGCCMEASGPLLFQLGIGRYLKERHKQWYKADLRLADRAHRKLAKAASVSGSHATIDLSNASDTICKELIKMILPKDWFDLLNSLRATHTRVGNRVVRLEKFSSMGNGFTFELETFLFRTLCEVLADGDITVFGDDIMVPNGSADVVIAALRYFGFTPNVQKTFCDGMFRESCGGDFFSGVDVRPHFLKELPDEPQKWVALANGLYRLGMERTGAWWFCVDQVPKDWRNFGPSSLGDLCFNSDHAEPTLRYHKPTGRPEPHWKIKLPVMRKVSLEKHFRPDVVLAAVLLGVPADVSLRKSVVGWRDGNILVYGTNDQFLEDTLKKVANLN